MRISTVLMAATASLLFASAAFADSCWDMYGTGDTSCGPQRPQANQRQPATNTPRSAETLRLREQLKRALAERDASAGRNSDLQRYQDRINDAGARIDAAVKDPQAPNAQQNFNAALKDLQRAYDDAANAAPERAEEFARAKAANERYATDLSESAWPAAAASASVDQAAPAPQESNVGVGEGGRVFVCDGPTQAPKAFCREIQPGSNQCFALIAMEGVVTWRDSTATPCSADDLKQRDAYLAQHPNEAAVQPDAPFTMTEAQVAQLECKARISAYIDAAQAQDGPAAQQAYEALREKGGCGVLAQAELQAKQQADSAAASDPRFVKRGDTPMLNQTAALCDREAAVCEQVVNQLRAGTSREATAALYANAISIGLQVGAMLGTAVLNAQAASMTTAGGGGTNMNSIGNRRIHSTYGSGGPLTPAPRTPPSDITGLGTH